MLVNREHSRLSSQVKTLEKALRAPYSDKEHQRLLTLAANWRVLLAFDDGAPKLAEALENFATAYQQCSPDQERLHDEVVCQVGVYRMSHWAIAWTTSAASYPSTAPLSSAGTSQTATSAWKRSRNCSRRSTH